jgi:hypothetical protein
MLEIKSTWAIERHGSDGLWHILWLGWTGECRARERFFDLLTNSNAWDNLRLINTDADGGIVLADDVLNVLTVPTA